MTTNLSVHAFLSASGPCCDRAGCGKEYLDPIHSVHPRPGAKTLLPLSKEQERAILSTVLVDPEVSEYVDYPSMVQGACAVIRALRRGV